jgi:hypothetical protein
LPNWIKPLDEFTWDEWFHLKDRSERPFAERIVHDVLKNLGGRRLGMDHVDPDIAMEVVADLTTNVQDRIDNG